MIANTVSTIELIIMALKIGKQLAITVVIANLIVLSCLKDRKGCNSLRALIARSPRIILC
jgi:hypothetical protein